MRMLHAAAEPVQIQRAQYAESDVVLYPMGHLFLGFENVIWT